MASSHTFTFEAFDFVTPYMVGSMPRSNLKGTFSLNGGSQKVKGIVALSFGSSGDYSAYYTGAPTPTLELDLTGAASGPLMALLYGDWHGSTLTISFQSNQDLRGSDVRMTLSALAIQLQG
jgi:hypothetical protein